ncbi:MAG TPA: hypothetical protein VGL23_08325, partial [Chloroflexota bacterium]
AALDRLRQLGAEVVGTLWTARKDGTGGSFHRRATYDQVEAILDSPRYHLRIGWSGRVPLPNLLDMTAAALGEIPPAALERVDLRPLNEWNLEAEGSWPIPELARLLVDYAARARIRWPRARLIVPPVSLAGDDAVGDLATLLEEMAAASRGGVPFDGLAVNAYGHLASDANLVTLAVLARSHLLEPHLTEINVEQLRGRDRVRWLTDRLEAAERLGYASAQVFILDGDPHGAWSEQYILSDEEAALLGQWRRSRSAPPLPEREGKGQSASRWAGREPPGQPTAVRPARLSGPSIPQPSTLSPQPVLGRGLWIWYAPRAGQLLDPTAATGRGIVAACRRANAHWVAIKGGDPKSPRDGSWPQLSPDLVAELREAGLSVFGWPYCYLEDVEREIALARWILAQGVDGLIADVEEECAGRWREAERYAAAVADLCGGRLFAYAPVPVVDFQQSVPYVQFNRACAAVMPQFYRRLLGATGAGDADLSTWTYDRLWTIWERWRETWAAWGIPTPPICPIGEAFAGDRAAGSVGPDEVAAFEAAVRARATPIWSYWELGQATPALLDAMAAADQASAQALDLPADLLAAVSRAADGIWSETEQLAALEHTGHAVAIQSGVVAIKRALGLQPASV